MLQKQEKKWYLVRNTETDICVWKISWHLNFTYSHHVGMNVIIGRTSFSHSHIFIRVLFGQFGALDLGASNSIPVRAEPFHLMSRDDFNCTPVNIFRAAPVLFDIIPVLDESYHLMRQSDLIVYKSEHVDPSHITLWAVPTSIENCLSGTEPFPLPGRSDLIVYQTEKAGPSHIVLIAEPSSNVYQSDPSPIIIWAILMSGRHL